LNYLYYSNLAAQTKPGALEAIVAKAMQQRMSKGGGGWRRSGGSEAPSSCLEKRWNLSRKLQSI
jgi:hypothetical protein